MPVRIVAATRSPFTRVDGALAGWHPVDLAAHVMTATLRAAPGVEQVDEVFVGCAEPVGAQGANMARAAVLAAGWADTIGGTVLDRAETSGSAALHAAHAAVASGAVSTAMVVGVCSATTVQPGASALARTYGRPWGDRPAERLADDGGLLPLPAAADRAAATAGIDRLAQDRWAAGSHERRSLVRPATLTPIDARPGDRVAMQKGAPVDDDDPRERPDDLDALPPSFDPDGSVTGFTFAPPADGCAALVLTADPSGDEILGVGRGAGHPLDPTGGVVAAVEAALPTGMGTDEIDGWEIVESTAAATLLTIERLGIDPAQVNRRGGTLAVGDAGAAEELRLVVDGLDGAAPGGLVMSVASGTSGAAATLLRRQ